MWFLMQRGWNPGRGQAPTWSYFDQTPGVAARFLWCWQILHWKGIRKLILKSQVGVSLQGDRSAPINVASAT